MSEDDKEDEVDAALDAEAETGLKVPWYHWLVCVAALLWNGFGAFDFVASLVGGDAYFRSMGMTEAQIAYMRGYPAWTYVVWFAGTWGAMAGAVLLIFRRRWALHAFIVSLAGFLLSLVYTYFLSNGAEVMGDMGGMQAGIFLGCVFFVWYGWFATKRGLLH